MCITQDLYFNITATAQAQSATWLLLMRTLIEERIINNLYRIGRARSTTMQRSN